MKKQKISDIKRLYLFFYLNKASIIILGISYLVLFVIFIMNANLPMNEIKYLDDSKYYLNYYFQNNLLIIGIFNELLFIILGTLEITTNSNNFDSLFISKIGRNKLILIKIYNYIKIVVVYVFFEFLLLMIIPIIFYSTFNFENSYINLFVCYTLLSVYLILFTVLLVYTINNYLASFIMVIFIIFNSVLKSSSIKINRTIAGFLIPIIDYKNIKNVSITNGYMYILTLIIVLVTTILIIYRHRDIKII